MATGVQRYINSASSGGDGTTNGTSGATAAWVSLLASWTGLTAAYGSGLVAADVQIDIDVTGLAAGSGSTVMPSFTQDATRFIRYRAASGQQHPGYYSATKAGFTDATLAVVYNPSSYTRFEKLQIVSSEGTTSNGFGFLFDSGANAQGLYVTGCVLHRYGRTAGSPTDGDAVKWSNVVSKGIVFANNVCSGSWHVGFRSDYNTGFGIIAYNNTIVGTPDFGFYFVSANNGTVTLKNNRVETTGTSYTIGGTQTTANNFSSDTSSPNGASYQSKTGTFTNAGAFDYSLAGGDAGLDVGADLSADASYAFAVDILGTTRPQGSAWDIGAFERAASAVSTRRRQVVMPRRSSTKKTRTRQSVIFIGAPVIAALVTPDASTGDRRRRRLVAAAYTLDMLDAGNS